MDWKRYTLVLALVLVTGCVSGTNRDRAFSKGWAHQVRKENEVAARKAYLRGDSELVVVDKEGALRTTVVTDEKGRPRLKVGGESGWGGNVRFRDGAPDVKVKYKIEWDSPRPRKPAPSDDAP